MFSKYIKYTKGAIRFFSKVHFHFEKALPNSKHSPFWMAPSFLWRHGWNLQSFVYNRVRHGVFSTAVVCRSRHDFFTYSLLQYTQFFHNGKALCNPVLYWFKQNWAYNANISKWRKFEAQFVKLVQIKIADSSSRSNILLFVAVIFLPGVVPTIQALPEANYSEL